MRSGKKRGILQAAVISGIIVTAVLIAGTYWNGRSASRDSEEAVRNVSLLYLDELAGRREQVVSATLDDYINDIDVALGLIEKEDLADKESLQAYQIRIKQLYDFDKFAFVDEDGLIYTSRGLKTDIDEYAFDYRSLTSPVISLKNADNDDKKLVIACPADRLPFMGKTLIACFMEKDMDSFLNAVSLRSSNNNTTFCNIYTNDGRSLTNLVLGGLSSEDNLLDALDNAQYERGYSADSVRQDFEEGREGIVSFTYNGIRETLSYVPVRNTGWMLTYLIRESVISEQIGNISQGIIMRSVVQSVLMAIVLFSVFAVLINQVRKAVRLESERENAEAMQQELEERIALQDELLAQEKTRAEQDKMITAMASDYKSVFYLDLDNDKGVCYRMTEGFETGVKEGDDFSHTAFFADYAEKYVTEEYRKDFLDFTESENIRSAIKKDIVITLRYLVNRGGEEKYEMLKMAGVRHPGDRDDRRVHAVGAGFTDIDAEMRYSLENNRALSDALKTAEEASKAKTIFLSNMSHEIRTPLNAIIGLDSLALNEEDISDNIRDYLEKIGSSAEHLLGLINDILDMSRIESGRMSLNNEEFSFSKLLEQINTIFSGQCQEKGLSYNCRINGSLSEYYIGDSLKLKQILINILGNAVKFTPEGGQVELNVEKSADFDGKSALKFRISDTGVGMSEEYMPKLFEAFSQESRESLNRYGSSGLGMAITRNIVEMMNGNIEVESRKGEGTVFTVTLTLTDSDRRDGNEALERDLEPGSMSVLIVDDEAIACEHAKLVLEKAGISAESANSGKEALEMVRLRHEKGEPYNLIIIDWKMPEMDGIETTKGIRTFIGDESAIIILTAYNWDDIRDDAIEAGVDSFVAKPLFSGNLLEEFRSVLKKREEKAQKERGKGVLSGKRILLAEDMSINARILEKILAMKEITTELSKNGEEAVKLFGESPLYYFDAILMDVRMPVMDGLEATVRIRALNRDDARKVPIIAITANAFDEDVQRSLQAGMNAHLSKPVQPDILFDTLENLIAAN